MPCWTGQQVLQRVFELELSHVGDTIIAKNHTKPTAGNSFLHYRSCHYPKWTNNIPRGQFCRLRQNCTLDTDYDTQSILLKKKFADKEYPKELVDQACDLYSKGKPTKKKKKRSQNRPFHEIHNYLQFSIQKNGKHLK